MASKKQHIPSGLELRAQRDARLADQADPKVEAARHEQSFLRNLNGAREDFQWLVSNQAWTRLGHDTFAGWWLERVQPVMDALLVKPKPELAQKVLDIVREEESSLPKPQQRTKRELAELVGVSEWKVRGRQDPRERRPAAGSDLDGEVIGDPVDEIPAEAKQAIQDRLDKQAAADDANAPADGAQHEPARTDAENAPAAGPDVQHEPTGPAVTPEDSTDEEPDAPNRDDSSVPPASDRGVSEPGGQADPEVPASETDESADGTEQDGTGVTRPAPDPSDPAALLDWFASVWERVDADVSGPLLTDDDMAMISDALERIAFGVELLTKWHERTRR